MKNLLTSFLLLICLVHLGHSQTFSLDADIRPRFEYRHGFGGLIPEEAKAAAFVTQRSRLNFTYSDPKLTVYMSVQDVSTWGDTQQLSIQDGNNSFSLFQAWLKYKIADAWAVKLGRQAISYDDQRILGEVDWAMQGRFHDAAMLTYSKNGTTVDLAMAYNQENQKNAGSDYTITGLYSYKVMQLMHYKKSWQNASLSLLFLNNGFQKYTQDPTPLPDGVYYRQTTGTYFQFPVSVFQFTGSAYLQTGKANALTDLTAYQYMLEAKFKPGKPSLTLGFESLSGTDFGGSEKNNSFFPLYGTNHKFNGLMDYFYVGNHANSVGLNDIYLKTQLPLGQKSSISADFHYFSSQAELEGQMDKYLGSEIDLVLAKSLSPNVKIQLGYSQMFGSGSLESLKGIASASNTNNWAWAMIVVNPNLLKISLDQK